MTNIRRAVRNAVDGRLAELGFQYSREDSDPREFDYVYTRDVGRFRQDWSVLIGPHINSVQIFVYAGWRPAESLFHLSDDWGLRGSAWRWTDDIGLEETLTRMLDAGLGLTAKYFAYPEAEPFDIESALVAARAPWAELLTPKWVSTPGRRWNFDYPPVAEYMVQRRHRGPVPDLPDWSRVECEVRIMRSWEQERALSTTLYKECRGWTLEPVTVDGQQWLPFEPTQADVERCLRALLATAVDRCEQFLRQVREECD